MGVLAEFQSSLKKEKTYLYVIGNNYYFYTVADYIINYYLICIEKEHTSTMS